MANPTSAFGWQMPTNTDLVKDLPSDFEVFGQAVDTTLEDLKGGTTGQVLSKASDTDMDFTWVAQDDSNAIQNAIVDAKGDLISATAADTPARLAVGTNGQFLAANSSTSTGLEWQTISAGGMTLISTANPSSSSEISFTSIPQTYNKLWIVGRLTPSASGSGSNYIQFNSDTGSNYYRLAFSSAGTTQASWGGLQNWHNNLTNTKPFTFIYELKNYTESTSDAIKIGEHIVAGYDYNVTTYLNTQYLGYRWYYKGSNVTSIQIGSATQTYTGTVSLYGVA